MRQNQLLRSESPWMAVKDGDPTARAIADRHYSRKKIGARMFVGPGEKLVLLSIDLKALFVWRISRFRADDQDGIECTVFRNEGEQKSSELIKEAEKMAIIRWPGEKRLFTYVDASKIRSTNPGHCFIKAGWKRVRGYRSKDRGLHLLVKEI